MKFLKHPGVNVKIGHYTRFILVGLVNTGLSYLIYAGFLFVGIRYAIANLLALLIGVLISFKMQGWYVFKNNNNRLLWRFVLSWAVIYLCVITLIGWIISFGFDAYTAGALTLPMSVVLSYIAQRFFVFRQTGMGG